MKSSEYNHIMGVKSKLETRPPRLLQVLFDRNSELVGGVIKVAREVEPILDGGILKTFPKYTLHNIDHSMRIMEYMFDLIEDIVALSDLEIAMLIYSALLHDIGMYATDEEIDQIKSGNDTQSNISYQAVLRKCGGNEVEALQEYIRRIHAKRSAAYVCQHLKDDLTLPSQPGTSFELEVAQICQSHNEDISWLKENLSAHYIKGQYSFNSMYCAVLLRLGDILDIDPQRTPPKLYELINPQGFSDGEWRQHFIIENQKKIQMDVSTRQKTIVLFGRCTSPAIHRKILGYIDWINHEIRGVLEVVECFKGEHQIRLKPAVVNKIEPQGYSISNMKIEMNFKALSHLLMGEKIYGDKRLGLRELIQNAIDACKVKYEIKGKDFWYEEYRPIVSVILNPGKNEVIIKDNGIGMTLEVLKKYFLNIGVSYYQSDEFLLRDFQYKPIGNFGIGFLACFMLSDEVIIRTKHSQSPIQYTLSLTKGSEFFCLSEENGVDFEGTEVILNYNQFIEVLGESSTEGVSQFLNEYFLTDDIQLRIIDHWKQDIISIANKLDDVRVKDGEYFIDISNYLEDVEGYIILELKGNRIIKSGLRDLPYSGDTVFVVSDGGIFRVNNMDFSLRYLYAGDNTINSIYIPLISTETDKALYNDAERLIEDDDYLIDSIENKFSSSVTLFLDQKIASKMYSNDFTVYEDTWIIEGYFEFDDLDAFGHDTSYPTKIYPYKHPVFLDEKTNNFLSLNQSLYQGFNFSADARNAELYLRNVKVQNHQFKPLFLVSPMSIKGVKLNITNSLIKPDISRNRLDEESGEIINFAIHKAILLWAFDNLPLKEYEKELLGRFIREHYSQSNPLMKKR